MKKLLTIAFCLFAGFSLTTAQVKLAFNPDKGVKYRYTQGMEQDMNQSMMGQEIPMKQSMVMAYDMEVLEKSAASMKLAFRFTGIFYEVSSAMFNMKYDSKSPTTDSSGMNGIMAKLFSAMLNQQLEATVLPDGSVTSVTGMDAIIEGMKKNVESEGAMAVQVIEGMKQQFSNEAMQKSFEQSFKIYPGKPLKVGESYEVKQEVGAAAGMTMNIQSTYQLVSVDKTTANLTVKSIIDGLDGQLKGEQSGTIQMDLKTGLAKEGDINQKFAGTISTQGMEVGIKADSKVKTAITVE